jgi:pimeloyl-ACP methyl ester carboxylesterase
MSASYNGDNIMTNAFQRMGTIVSILLMMHAYLAPSIPPTGHRETIPAQEYRVASEDVDLFVRVAGNLTSGKVLLALNGGPGVSSRYMTDLEVLTGDNLALVTFDQRGVGRSTAPALDVSNFVFEKYLDDIEAIRQTLRIKSFHILGHSWGGILALKYAVAHPDKVDSLILIGNGPIKDSELKAFLGKIRERVIELIKQGIIDGKLERHSDIYPAYLSNPRFKPPFDLIPDLNEPVMNLTFQAITGYDLTNDLPRIHKKIMLLWGADDPVGLDVAEDTKTALSGAQVELVVIKECGHFWQEKPQEFLTRIRAFLINSNGG